VVPDCRAFGVTFASQRCRIRTRLPAAYFLIQLVFFVGLALAGLSAYR